MSRTLKTTSKSASKTAKAIPPEIATAFALLGAGAFVLTFYELGAHAAHMALHIALMNIVAPVAASLYIRRSQALNDRTGLMWIAAVAQVALLWMWHLPALQAAAVHSPGLSLIMQGSLFAVALLFWGTVLGLNGAKRWHAIPVLLLTGKLVCLLAALMIFAPRMLYEMPMMHGDHAALPSLDDQQLAGLLMITACPLSYIVVGLLIVARLLAELNGDRPALKRRMAAR